MKFSRYDIVKFTTISWFESDEAHKSQKVLLVEPVFRYSESMLPSELIEDVQADIAIDIQSDSETPACLSDIDVETMQLLVDRAEKIVEGHESSPRYHVTTSSCCFVPDNNGEVQPITDEVD